jgi:hypothetical protein
LAACWNSRLAGAAIVRLSADRRIYSKSIRIVRRSATDQRTVAQVAAEHRDEQILRRAGSPQAQMVGQTKTRRPEGRRMEFGRMIDLQ